MIGTEIIPFGPFEAEKIGFKVSNLKLGNLGYWIFQNREGHFKVSVLIGKPTARGFQNTP